MTTEHIENYVKYNEKHGVLICIPHGYGLVPGDGIGRHFQYYRPIFLWKLGLLHSR